MSATDPERTRTCPSSTRFGSSMKGVATTTAETGRVEPPRRVSPRLAWLHPRGLRCGVGCLLLGLLAGCEEVRASRDAGVCVENLDAGQNCSRIHGDGIQDPQSPEFHVQLLRSTAYDFDLCEKCHGRDLEGGKSGISCVSCHEKGPTACVTCHEKLPLQGAHRAHLAGATVEQPSACAGCHQVPQRWDSPGHIRDEQGALDPFPVELRFTGKGEGTRFDPTSKSCDALCHGARLPPTGAQDAVPHWNEPHQELGCQRCHGFPPTTIYHADNQCQNCHPRVANGAGDLLGPELHQDGKIDLGPDGSGRCESCHASIRTDVMHQTHAQPSLRLSSNVLCESCHLLPETVTSTGHLDSLRPVEVFPAGQRSIAWSNGAMPRYDAATRSCSGTWCHGVATEIPWTRPEGQVVCGSCHAVPPADASHPLPMTLRDCATCHDSVDAYGNPKLVETGTTVRTHHLDGKVDIR